MADYRSGRGRGCKTDLPGIPGRGESIVYCSKCGNIYRRIAWNNRGKHSTVWRCCTRVEHGPKKYDAPTIQESDL